MNGSKICLLFLLIVICRTKIRYMDDKLKNFLEDKDDNQLDKDISKSLDKVEAPKEEVNKYDKFFGDDADELMDKVKDGLGKAGEMLSDGLKETTEFLGDSLKETGRFFKEGSEGAGKILKEDIIPKAKEAKEKLDVKVDDLTEKLKDYADAPIEKTEGSGLDESLFDTHDGFFSKMEKYADKLDGKVKEGDIEITEISKPEPKPKDDSKLFGFDDLDNDGDELIDDAIIDLD